MVECSHYHVYWSAFIASDCASFSSALALAHSGPVFIAAIKHQRINNLLFKANELTKSQDEQYTKNYSFASFLRSIVKTMTDWREEKNSEWCCLVFFCMTQMILNPQKISVGICNMGVRASKADTISMFSLMKHFVCISKCFRWISIRVFFLSRCELARICFVLFCSESS